VWEKNDLVVPIANPGSCEASIDLPERIQVRIDHYIVFAILAVAQQLSD
jgi:hypothetical protein